MGVNVCVAIAARWSFNKLSVALAAGATTNDNKWDSGKQRDALLKCCPDGLAVAQQEVESVVGNRLSNL